MATYEYTIQVPLPTLNELIDASKGNRYSGTRMKKQATDDCTWPAKSLPRMDAVKVKATFYRPTKNYDPDNIVTAGIKVVIDGLQAAGVLENDGWKQIKPPFELGWGLDKNNPRVEVELTEVEDG